MPVRPKASAIVVRMGHRSVPHTADVRIEAWAESREECLAEAVAATVASFVDTTDARNAATTEVLVGAGTDEDLLLDLLNEVVYRVDTTGQVPLHTEVEARDGGVRVRFAMADADKTDEVESIGAAPKAVSLHDLRFGRDGTHHGAPWSCSVTLDV